MQNFTMNILNHKRLNLIQPRLPIDSIQAIQPLKSLKQSVIYATTGRMMFVLYGLTEEEIRFEEGEK